MNIEEKQNLTSQWFKNLRDKICAEFEKIEVEFNAENPGKFVRKNWDRPDKSGDGGSGEMSLMKGNVFEKVGVNFSKVYGEFSEEFRKQIAYLFFLFGDLIIIKNYGKRNEDLLPSN